MQPRPRAETVGPLRPRVRVGSCGRVDIVIVGFVVDDGIEKTLLLWELAVDLY
jgi:hypothetical protein